MRIVLDAMGSDNHPIPEVDAAIMAADLFGDEILLVGNNDVLFPLLQDKNINNSPVRIIHAPEAFLMTDKISGRALKKAQNSMGIGMDLIKNGEADAFVTAGNTGGAMSIGLVRLGRIKGVKRPALTAALPVKGGVAILTDIGANADCKPIFLVQFAIMGAVYAEKVLGKRFPKVALISNGEEEGKGNALVKATYPLMKQSGLNFIGNIEGKEFFGGEADVAVTDGFTGNVMVKASEAVAKLLVDTLKEGLKSSPLTKAGALLAKPAFNQLKALLDPGEIGAVPLLGLNGLVFVGHGRSDAKALLSSIRQARTAVEHDLLNSVKDTIASRL